MAQNKFDIYVYAHWKGMSAPRIMGVLSGHFAKGKKAFSFEYDRDWVNSGDQRLLDPDIQFFSGTQFPNNKESFGIFLDSMPDTWGRTLMKRRAAQQAKERNERASTLYDIDYLLGVFDESRMGALRFKTEPDGPFLDNDNSKDSLNCIPTTILRINITSSIRPFQKCCRGIRNNTPVALRRYQ